MKETFDTAPLFWQFTPFKGESMAPFQRAWRLQESEVTMAKPEWGEKHRCGSCGKPFYDMKKTPIICPSCGTEHTPERLLKPRRSVGAAAAEATKKAAALKKKSSDLLDDELDDDDDLDADLDDDLIDPDTVDLADDDEDEDDLSGVISAPKTDDDV